MTNISRTCIPGKYDKLILLNNEHPTTELRRLPQGFLNWGALLLFRHHRHSFITAWLQLFFAERGMTPFTIHVDLF